MTSDSYHRPLAPDHPVAVRDRLLAHVGTPLPLDERREPTAVIALIAQAVGHLPYENLGKVADRSERGSIRLPTIAETVDSHLENGSGGTCFALTDLLCALLVASGFDARPILADRTYGPATHCAVRVELQGKPLLVDPGYLIHEPLPLLDMAVIRETPFHRLELVPIAPGGRELATIERASSAPSSSTGTPPRRTYRLTYRIDPVDDGEFRDAWLASYDWPMMTYPVIAAVDRSRQLFVRGDRWQERSDRTTSRRRLDRAALIDRLVNELGMRREWVERAWRAFPDAPSLGGGDRARTGD
ncbi:MAG TPA: arylamine N-acetyltransferase [Pirellulaceae bacterium]|nr:arylamine N-acetyltransferase [Pirellulaceae bacterium]